MRGRGSKFWIGAVLLAAACCRAQSGDDVPGVDTVRFRNYGTSEGLSQSTVRALAQDKTGFIWVGTQDGLDRFDGYTFKVYRHDRADPWSLADNHVLAIVNDGDIGLWLATQAGGLEHYDPALDRFTAYRADAAGGDALASNSVNALLHDSRGRLWVASGVSGLQWFEPATQNFREVPLGASPPHNVVALAEQADGSVLVGARDGLWHCDGEGHQLAAWRYAQEPPLDVTAIAQARDGTVWAATAMSGLYEFSAAGVPLAHYRRGDAAHDLADNELRALAFDRDGRLWIATMTSGLIRLSTDRSRYNVYRHDPTRSNSLAAQRQQSLLVDRDGLVWAGSWVNGVSLHDPRTEAFAEIHGVPGEARSLLGQSVTAVAAEGDGTYWMAVSDNGGLVRFDPARGVVARYTHDPQRPGSMLHGLVRNMLRARDGSVWLAGTGGGGLARLPPGSSTFTHFRHAAGDDASLASDEVAFLAEDRNGTLWVGTMTAGLDELCAGCTRFKHHRHDAARADSLGGDRVSYVLETRRGTLWVGLLPDGLDRYDRAHDRFEHFRAHAGDPASLSNDAVTGIFEDHRGELWIGTQGGGLNHLLPESFDAPRFEAITTANGLAADAIGGIIEDAHGMLWISTTVGISRYDPESRHVVNFGGEAGAISQGYFIADSAQSDDGRIVFGSPGGATLFNPAAVTLPPAPMPILTGVLLNNQPVPLRWREKHSPLESAPWLNRDRVEFNHRQNNVSFEFSAFGYGDPESIEYSYMLQGHDWQWIDTTATRRFATYTDLAPGNYRLRVRARRDGDAWSQDEAGIAVRVLPAPWASWPAIIAYAATALLLGALIAWRTRAALERRRRTQAAIQVSEQRLKFALWGSGGELWDVNLRDGTFVQENRIPGLAIGAVAGRAVREYRDYVHPDDLPAFQHALIKHLKGNVDFFEASYRTPDLEGGSRWLLTRGRVVERSANGRALRIVGTTQDISMLKRAEESLRKLNEELESRVELRTEALSRANAELRNTLEELRQAQHQLLESEKMAALGGVVAGVAHEINTPLGVTVTAASHLQEQTRNIVRLIEQNKLTPEALADFHETANESADIILRNLRRADRLIKSFKLIAVDQTTEERRSIELGAYLDEILISLGPTLKKTPHRVSVEHPEPIEMDTYPGALYQIVSNLVMNSLTHAFDNSRPGQIAIQARREGAHVLLRYRDDGRGMSEAVRAQIFEPFFTTRRGEGGSGLGMHVVYNLVTQLLKGTIRVDSAPGRGVLFEISLPLESERAAAMA